MRPVLPGDLDAATRLLLTLPPGARAGRAAALVAQADTADRWRKRTGRAHPRWGDGSLMAAARLAARPAPVWRCDAAYCAALAAVLRALADRRSAGWQRSGRHDPA